MQMSAIFLKIKEKNNDFTHFSWECCAILTHFSWEYLGRFTHFSRECCLFTDTIPAERLEIVAPLFLCTFVLIAKNFVAINFA